MTTLLSRSVSIFFFSSRRRHTRSLCDWSSDVCSSDLTSTSLNALLATLGVTRQPRERIAAAADGVPAAGGGMTAVPTVGAAPRLLAEQDGHNIVEYEGWIYGIPHDLGPMDLTETDVIAMPGVIR